MIKNLNFIVGSIKYLEIG